MLIVLVIAFISIAVIGSLIKRHYNRKHDKMKGTFNQGITQRSAPMTTAPGAVPYNYDGPAGSVQGAPETSAMMKKRSVSDMTGHPDTERGGAPIEEMEMKPREPKGKGRAGVDDIDRVS